MRRRGLILIVTFFCIYVGTFHPVHATTEITPPRIVLTAEQREGFLTIINHRDVAAGYNIEAFGWEQEPNGEVRLPPTKDIRVEPTLLSIPAHGNAKVRIIALGPAPSQGEPEKVYRIRIAERTDRERMETEKQLQVIASFTLPVFQKPPYTAYKGRITFLPLIDGKLTFTVHNDGTGHTYIGDASITGSDIAGQEIFHINRRGWYILANSALQFKAVLAREDCLRSRTITVAAQVLESDETWSTDITPDAVQCGDGTVSEFPVTGIKKLPQGFKPGDPMPEGLKPLSAPLK